ncbi:MAG: hypothetical protein AAGJ35_09130 [Myxococcota bacterium]
MLSMLVRLLEVCIFSVSLSALFVSTGLASKGDVSQTSRADAALIANAAPIAHTMQRMQWSLVSPPNLFQHQQHVQKLLPTPSSMDSSTHAKQQAKHLRTTLVAKAPRAFPERQDRTPQTQQCKTTKACEMSPESEDLVKMLHQIFGISSLVLLTATVVIGQINAIDFFQGRLSPQGMLWAHRGLSIATAVAYGGARVLAWLLPTHQYDDDDDGGGGFDSAKAHNVLSWMHGIGMIALIVGGVINARVIPSSTDAKIAMTVGHLAAGYFTWGTLASAAIVITFF